MKTGRLECYIPSAETASCDVKNVFVSTHCHGYDGKVLDSVVMTTQAKSMISYGLIQYHHLQALMWCLVLLSLYITCLVAD
jgi:hypothetical protein